MHRTKKQQSKPEIPIIKPKSQTNSKLENKAKTQAVSFCAMVFLGCGIFRCGIFEFGIFCGILCNNIIW